MQFLNQRKIYMPLFIIVICLIIVLMFFIWYAKDTNRSAEAAKSKYNAYVIETRNNQQRIVQNRAATQKMEDNPKMLEKRGREKVEKYLQLAYKQQSKSTDQIKKDYDLMLRSDVAKNVRNNSEFNKVFAPKDYKIYPNIARGSSMDFYIENTGDDKLFTNDMIITYDMSANKIIDFKTFRDRGDN